MSALGGILVLLGYLWVEEADNAALLNQQRQALATAKVLVGQFYEDVGCARHDERPKRQACLEALKSGDTLVVWTLERLADSRAHLLETLRILDHRNAGLKVLSGKGAVINSAHISLGIIGQVTEAVAELEAHVNREASLAGRATAKAKGQTFGSKLKVTAAMLQSIQQKLADTNISFTSVAEEHGITRATLYRYLNGDGSPTDLGQEMLEANHRQS